MESPKVLRIQNESGLWRSFAALKNLLDGRVWILTLQPEVERRRSIQNRRYWAVLNEIADQLGYDDETWHHYFARRFIGVKDVRLPDGEIIHVGQSTTELSVGEFTDYMTSIEAWAVEKGVIFNDP